MALVSEVTYTQTHHVAMAPYEWVELKWSATAQAANGETAEELAELARESVEAALAEDLDRAIEATSVEDTYVDVWVNGPTRRNTRKRSRVR